MLFSLVVLLSLLGYIAAQSVSLNVPIDSKSYPISYNAHETSSADAAKSFCINYAAEFGLTNDSLPNCTIQVADWLKGQTAGVMKDYVSKNTIIVPLTIDKLKFDVTFRTDKVKPSDMATQLCSEHAGSLGITRETLPSCVAPVSKFLQDAVDTFVRQRTIAFRMTLNKLDFDIRLRLDLQTSIDMAVKICREHRVALNVNDNNFKECITLAGDYIQQQINAATGAQTIKVPIKIGNLQTTLEMIPNLEDVQKVAKKACSAEYRAQTGILEANTAECAQGVETYIRQWYTAQVQAAKQ